MHPAAFTYVEEAVRQFGPFEKVLELGGRNVNGTIRDLFGDCHYLALDIFDGEGVDIVADAADYRHTELLDVVVCCETLEHTPRADEICQASYDNLKYGGVFIMTTAGETRGPHSAVDGGPVREGEYYGNIAEWDLVDWLLKAGFRLNIISSLGDDIRSVSVK